MNDAAPHTPTPQPGGKRWPALIIGLLLSNAVFCAVTAYFATSDPSFAVEPDAYQKGLAWNEQVAARRASDALGWSIDLAIGEPDEIGRRAIQLTLADRDGAAIEGLAVEGTIFHQARAANRLPLTFAPTEPGRYTVVAPLRRDGWWQFELNAQRGDDRFITNLKRYVGAFRPR